LNSHPDGRKMKNTGQNCLTTRTSCSVAYNIKYKLYICIYIYMIFLKKIVSEAEATTQTPHDTHVGLAQALLNGSCLVPAR
jgi:hypothetical protein